MEKEIKEKILKPMSGFAGLFIICTVMFLSVFGQISGVKMIVRGYYAGGILFLLASIVIFGFSCGSFAGLKTVKPNEALVLSLFGKYHGTIYEPGFYYVNMFCQSVYPAKRDAEAKKNIEDAAAKGQVKIEPVNKKVSTKLTTFANPAQKVNDKLGNPVEVSAIVVWKVVNATKAVISVDNYQQFLSDQADSAIRNIARLYPYDVIDDNPDDGIDEKTLRGSATEIANQMKGELAKKTEVAGIEILEVRLNQIAYATEIAAAMLQRQQAIAIIAARKKIVEGAVSMVEMALEQLKKDGVVDLDEERKAAMVSNLLVVLCGNKEANPVVNTGSIY